MPEIPAFCPGRFTPVLTPMYSDEDEDGGSEGLLSGFLVNPSLGEDDFFVNLALKQAEVAFPFDLPTPAPAPQPVEDISLAWSTPPEEETFHGFPLSKEDNEKFQTAYFLGVTDFPVSFGCGVPQHFDAKTLTGCPCFGKSLGPVQLTYLRDKFTENAFAHSCSSCAWCSRCPAMPNRLSALCSGQSVDVFRKPHVADFLRFLGTNTRVLECRLAPLSRQESRRLCSMKVAPFAPRLLCGLSPRFFDTACPRGCPEPLRASKFTRNLTFEEYCRRFGAYGYPRSDRNGPLDLVPLILILALLFLLLLLAILSVALLAVVALLYKRVTDND